MSVDRVKTTMTSTIMSLAWCRRVVYKTNDWDSNNVIDLLTTNMLLMKFAKRLFANVCLTKEYDLRLFDEYFLDLESITSTQQMTSQSEINHDDDSITIILNALWNTKVRSSKHHIDIRTNCFDFDLIFELLSSSSSIKRNEHHKRQRFFVVESFDNDRFKRRALKVHSTNVSNLHFLEISNEHLKHDDELNHIYTIYDALLALFAKLLRSKSQNIDDRTSTLIRELLTRLKIITLRLTQNDILDQVIVAIDTNCRQIVLVNLNSLQLMSSIIEMIAHLLHTIQISIFRLANISTVSTNDSSKARSRSCTIKSIDRSLSRSISQQYEHTFSSTFLNYIKISNCFISS